MQLGLFTILGVLAAVVVLSWTAVRIASTVSRERTRRELFAYVAEKSITMEEAARLLELCDSFELRRSILDTASSDTDWDRWRETVSKVVGGDAAGAPGKAAGAG